MTGYDGNDNDDDNNNDDVLNTKISSDEDIKISDTEEDVR